MPIGVSCICYPLLSNRANEKPYYDFLLFCDLQEVTEVSVYGIERGSYYTNIGQKLHLNISATQALLVHEPQYTYM